MPTRVCLKPWSADALEFDTCHAAAGQTSMNGRWTVKDLEVYYHAAAAAADNTTKRHYSDPGLTVHAGDRNGFTP